MMSAVMAEVACHCLGNHCSTVVGAESADKDAVGDIDLVEKDRRTAVVALLRLMMTTLLRRVMPDGSKCCRLVQVGRNRIENGERLEWRCGSPLEKCLMKSGSLCARCTWLLVRKASPCDLYECNTSASQPHNTKIYSCNLRGTISAGSRTDSPSNSAVS